MMIAFLAENQIATKRYEICAMLTIKTSKTCFTGTSWNWSRAERAAVTLNIRDSLLRTIRLGALSFLGFFLHVLHILAQLPTMALCKELMI